jgi:hypothetical protein
MQFAGAVLQSTHPPLLVDGGEHFVYVIDPECEEVAAG